MLLREVDSAGLTTAELAEIRTLMDVAFEGDFADEDMDHGLGGRHFLAVVDGRVASHASVVMRDLEVDGRPFRAGYVEAVATAPDLQGRGLGTAVMRAATDHVVAAYELGTLGTGAFGFYERLGWERWRGPSAVRLSDGTLRRTPDEDGFLMVLRTGPSANIDLGASLTCEWRAGDVW
jgi:aminoglycoside 2'-N-acetyltransferase I